MCESLKASQPHAGHPLHSSTFLTSSLIRFATCILGYQCTETDLPIGNDALVGMVQVAKYYVLFPHPDPTVFPALIKLLREIFNEKKHFYSTSHPSQDCWALIQDITKKNMKFAQVDIPLFHYLRYHELFFYNGNIFGLDGFLGIIARLGVPFTLQLEIVQLFQTFCNAYTHHSRKALVIPLRDAIFETLLNMSEEDLRPINNTEIERVISSLEDLELVNRRVHTKPYETFVLDFSLKCLRCSILPKRLHGIDSIDQIAQTSQQQEQLRQYHDARYVVESCITPAELAAWIVSNRILEIIYGKKTHEELVRRSKDILVLLARENALSDELMDLVWDRGTRAREREREEEREKVRDENGWSSLLLTDRFPSFLLVTYSLQPSPSPPASPTMMPSRPSPPSSISCPPSSPPPSSSASPASPTPSSLLRCLRCLRGRLVTTARAPAPPAGQRFRIKGCGSSF